MSELSPQRRYELANLKTYTFRLNIKHDADVIAEIEKQDNKQGYVKALIRADIERSSTMKVLIENMPAANCNGGNYPRVILTDGVRVLGVANTCGCHRGCSNTENLATGEWSKYPTEYISEDKMDAIMAAYVAMRNAL